MALKRSEKMLVGLGLGVGGIALLIGVGLPQWDAFSAANSQISTTNDEIKALESQQINLNAQIALLEKNTDIPPGINIRTYNDQNREEVIKAMLDQVVNLATGTGNKFIALNPDTEDPLSNVTAPSPSAAPAPAANTTQTPAAGATTTDTPASANGTATTNATDPNALPPPPPPILSTFSYVLSIRGTYGSLQDFLRSLDSQKELMEVSGINIENEAGADRSSASGGAADVADPGNPLKLTANIRIVLQPE